MPADSVRQIVNASWDKFTDKPIRDFVPVLVERSAQEQLRSGRGSLNLELPLHHRVQCS
jgi:hypothetical protein